MRKIKFDSGKIKFFFYLRLVLSIFLPFIFLWNLLMGSSSEAILYGLLSVLFIFSTVKYYKFLKKSKNKTFVEIKVNPKKIIKKRMTVAIVSFVIALVPLYFIIVGYQGTNILNDPVSWLLFFIFMGIISFWRIYQLKRLVKLSK